MRVPQVNERVKEAPASALRAMFAGIGSLLSVTDKIRAKPAAETTPETEAAAPATTAEPEVSTGPEATAVPETTVDPEATVIAESTAAPEAAAPEIVVSETTAVPDSAALPLPNYDELTIASLRARLRNLSADQLTVLISYEKSHADRADVISMFERRITKLALGLTQTLPKLTE
jgi:hypothetical protein